MWSGLAVGGGIRLHSGRLFICCIPRPTYCSPRQRAPSGLGWVSRAGQRVQAEVRLPVSVWVQAAGGRRSTGRGAGPGLRRPVEVRVKVEVQVRVSGRPCRLGAGQGDASCASPGPRRVRPSMWVGVQAGVLVQGSQRPRPGHGAGLGHGGVHGRREAAPRPWPGSRSTWGSCGDSESFIGSWILTKMKMIQN